LTGPDIGRVVFSLLALLAGMLLIAAAVRAVHTGVFAGPRRIVHGTPSGVAYIHRRERPGAFWLCVVSCWVFGLSIMAGAWYVL
jgi:hypothetical protein